AISEDERVVVRQRCNAGPQPDVPRALGCRGDEHLRRADDFEAARMVLADPGFVVVQLVDVLQQFHVALQRERWVLRQIVKRRQKDAAAQVAHGLASWDYWPVG